MIYVTEPGHTGGVGAMGMRVLHQTLRDAGHAVKRVRLFSAAEDADQQLDMFGRDDERVVDHTWLAKPDAWFVSVLYVRQFVDIRDMFARMGVPMRTEDRSPSDPLVAFGGQFSITPEPLAEFADVIALGDGELTGTRIAQMLSAGAKRLDIMRDLRGVRGFYVPSFGVDRFERWEAPSYTAVTVRGDNTDVIELARGCESKCAFCRIGWAGGTYREAPREEVETAIARAAGKNVSIFAPDYSAVSYVEDVEKFVAEAGCRNIARDARADYAHKHLKSGRGVKSYNFGIEGMSERLRAAVGKPLKHERLIGTMRMLADAGINHALWYMLFALPGETDEDFADLIRAIDELDDVYLGALNFTCSQVKGLPHTPLERISNAYDSDGRRRWEALRDHCRDRWEKRKAKFGAALDKSVAGPHRGVRIVKMYKSRELHEYESTLVRSGREAARFIEVAKASDIANGRWRDKGLNLDLLSAIPEDAPTAWDHVIAGPPREARAKALANYWRAMRRGKSLPVLGETRDGT